MGPILLQVVSGWLSELSLPGRCGMGQPTAPFCALPNGSLNKAGLTCHRSPTAGVGLPKASLLVIGRGRLPRHAAGGQLGFRVLTVAGALWKYLHCRVPALLVCRLGVSVREHVVVRGWRGDATWGEAIGACSPPVREGRWVQFFRSFFLGPNFRGDHSLLPYVWGCQVGFSEQGSGDRVNCERGTFTPA